MRKHLDGANRPPVARGLFFAVVGLGEKFVTEVNNPLDMDVQGMTEVLRQNQEALETELSEMEAELSMLDIGAPWYVRLAYKTGEFAWLYSENKKKLRLQSELQEAPQ